MTVCIDTNAVLGLFTAGHPYRPLFDAWFTGSLRWAVSTEILLEYEEVMIRRAGASKAALMKQVMSMVAILHQNCPQISPSFRFQLITSDPDDNKFVDCAVAAEAAWVITSDHHFDVLAGSGYKPQPITPEAFILQYLSS